MKKCTLILQVEILSLAFDYLNRVIFNDRYHKRSMLVSPQHDVDQILWTIRILEGEHLGAAAGEVDHGLGSWTSFQGLVAARQLGVGFLQKSRPKKEKANVLSKDLLSQMTEIILWYADFVFLFLDPAFILLYYWHFCHIILSTDTCLQLLDIGVLLFILSKRNSNDYKLVLKNNSEIEQAILNAPIRFCLYVK